MNKKEIFYDEINYITGVNPAVYTLSVQNILNKFNYFLTKGYSKEESKFITVKLPNVFSYSIDGLDEKIEILKQNDLEKEILNRPSYLMQGAILSYSRISYLKENNVVLNHRAFNYLVMSGKDFKKRFGVSNEEVKERYPFKR